MITPTARSPSLPMPLETLGSSVRLQGVPLSGPARGPRRLTSFGGLHYPLPATPSAHDSGGGSTRPNGLDPPVLKYRGVGESPLDGLRR